MLPSQMVMRFILKYSVHQKWPDAFKFIKNSTKCSKYSILRSLLISLEYTFFFVFYLGCCCWSLQIYKLVWPLVLLAKKMRFPLMAHIFMWIGRFSIRWYLARDASSQLLCAQITFRNVVVVFFFLLSFSFLLLTESFFAFCLFFAFHWKNCIIFIYIFPT